MQLLPQVRFTAQVSASKTIKISPFDSTKPTAEHQGLQMVGNAIFKNFSPGLPFHGAIAGVYPITQQLQQILAISFRWNFSAEEIRGNFILSPMNEISPKSDKLCSEAGQALTAARSPSLDVKLP